MGSGWPAWSHAWASSDSANLRRERLVMAAMTLVWYTSTLDSAARGKSIARQVATVHVLGSLRRRREEHGGGDSGSGGSGNSSNDSINSSSRHRA